MAYARSAIVAHAKAYGLQAIDLVCVAYDDVEVRCLAGVMLAQRRLRVGCRY